MKLDTAADVRKAVEAVPSLNRTQLAADARVTTQTLRTALATGSNNHRLIRTLAAFLDGHRSAIGGRKRISADQIGAALNPGKPENKAPKEVRDGE